MSIISTPRSARSAEQRPALIEWSRPSEDLWVGRIHLDYAGMVELVDGDYVVTDWKNERIAAFASLDEAQLSLEPSARVSALETVQRRAERAQWIASASITVTVVTAAAVGGWFLSAV